MTSWDSQNQPTASRRIFQRQPKRRGTPAGPCHGSVDWHPMFKNASLLWHFPWLLSMGLIGSQFYWGSLENRGGKRDCQRLEWSANNIYHSESEPIVPCQCDGLLTKAGWNHGGGQEALTHPHRDSPARKPLSVGIWRQPSRTLRTSLSAILPYVDTYKLPNMHIILIFPLLLAPKNSLGSICSRGMCSRARQEP